MPKWGESLFEDPLVQRAMLFARDAHAGQFRKKSKLPYITHPIGVAKLVSQATEDPLSIAAALLHDVVEDTAVTNAQVVEAFGRELGELVFYQTAISRPADGNRAARKALDARHYAMGCMRAQTVRVADMIHNLSSDLAGLGEDFAGVYLKEKRFLLSMMVRADSALVEHASNLIDSLGRDLHGELPRSPRKRSAQACAFSPTGV